jgi:hypothetical protein
MPTVRGTGCYKLVIRAAPPGGIDGRVRQRAVLTGRHGAHANTDNEIKIRRERSFETKYCE